VWIQDYARYKNKWGENALLQQGYYWSARMYEKISSDSCGWLQSSNKGFGNAIFCQDLQNAIAQHVVNNADRRRKQERLLNQDVKKNQPQFGYEVDNMISSIKHVSEDFTATDTLYEGVPCYMLVRRYKRLQIYGKKEQERLAKKMYSEEKKNRLHHLYTLSGNATHTGSIARIISKADDALLYQLVEAFSDHGSGNVLTYMTEEKFIKVEKIYRQAFYKDITHRRNRDGFLDVRGIYTYRISLPLYQPLPMSASQPIPNKLPLNYEDFCIRIERPDNEMLINWLNISTTVGRCL
jgi:hypothetical protein